MLDGSLASDEDAVSRLPISIALIDPKPLTRQSMRDVLTEAFPESAMVAVSTCEELLELDERQIGKPNLVVVYIRNEGLTSTWVQSALELLRARLPEASTVVLADRDDADEVNRALTHGVRGYIPTSIEWEVAVAALRLISAGGTFVPADALRSTAAKPDDQPEGERQGRSDGLDLTPRELSVIDLLREGKPNKLIAAQLDMQENTVKVHVRNILKKLNATNRTLPPLSPIGYWVKTRSLSPYPTPSGQLIKLKAPARQSGRRLREDHRIFRAKVDSPIPTCRSNRAPRPRIDDQH
jgi:DNA-binding NarL/FixJ family response regulator